MNQSDFDLEQFVDLFDTAMTSDNPTVKKAFKNLMIVATLVNAENEPKIGPLRELMTSLNDLRSRVATLEASKYSSYGPITTNTPGMPTWTVGTPTPYTTGNIPAVGIAPTYTSTTLAGNASDKYAGYSLDNIYTKLDDK